MQQEITDVSLETLPLNLICVLDVSGSVSGPPLANLKDALTALIDALAPADRAALVTFSERLQIHTPLTSDRSRLRSLVERVEAGGATSVIDAAFAGLALREVDEGRTLMLLFSDGRDTSSWLSARTVLDAARRTDVVMYPVNARMTNALNLPQHLVPFGDADNRNPPSVPRQTTPISGSRFRDEVADSLLEAFADETGGRMFSAEGEGALRKTFLNVLAEFRQRYVLSYTPAKVPADGWHTLEVKLRGRRGQVKARRGYFAAAPPATPGTRSDRR